MPGRGEGGGGGLDPKMVRITVTVAMQKFSGNHLQLTHHADYNVVVTRAGWSVHIAIDYNIIANYELI